MSTPDVNAVNTISDERRQRAYAEGITFQQFVEQAEVNQELLRSNYEAYELTEDDLAVLNALPEPLDVIVLAHDWCGDVASNLPLFAKLEELTGKLRLHILIRDPDNWDIAHAYPAADGKHRLPTYIFLDPAGKQLGTFIERPEEITQMIPTWREQFWKEHPEWNWEGQTIDVIGEEGVAAWRAYMMSQRQQIRSTEKDGIIRALREILG